MKRPFSIGASGREVSLAAVLLTAALAGVCGPARAETGPAKAPAMTLDGATVPANTPIQLSKGTFRLAADADATFATKGIRVNAPNGTATIDLQPATAAPATAPATAGKPPAVRTLTLEGGVTFGTYTTLAVTGAPGYVLALPTLSSSQPGTTLAPASAALTVGTAECTGELKLDGAHTASTLGLFKGAYLQKQGQGTWTLVGDNSPRKWNGVVLAGTLAVAANASTGSGVLSLEKGATLALAPKARAGALHVKNGATIDLADGTLGQTTLTGPFAGPGGGSVTIRFDLSAEGTDELVLAAGVTNACAIKDVVEFNILGHALKPGTYRLVTSPKGGNNLMENHFGFDFTGNPADHRNILTHKTVTVGEKKYDLELLSAEEISRTQTVTLTVRLLP